MKNLLTLITIALALVVTIMSTFTLPEHEQALILQLGKINSAPITQSGLHWKIPFIQEVRYFEKRVLQWDGEGAEIPTKDKKFIWVDTTARWQIADALAFYKAVRDVPNALLRMGTILEGITRDTISSYNLIEAVRSSNEIFKEIAAHRKESEKAGDQETSDSAVNEMSADDVIEVTMGREKLSALIAERARTELKQFGINLLDVQLRSIAYKEVVEQKVYARMISERQKIATKIRSSGRGEEAKILGQLDLALKKIESDAYRSSQQIRGKAEAEAIKIFASTLAIDPSFYEFTKTLETYRKTLPRKGQFILSTDSAFFRILNKGN